MFISQSLIKDVIAERCPRAIYYSFVEGIDNEGSDAMKLGRYFESELIGACRGGLKEEARYNAATIAQLKSRLDEAGISYDSKSKLSDLRELCFECNIPVNGEKAAAYIECDELILFAKDVCDNLGIDISKGQSQLSVQVEGLSASIDHRNLDLVDKSRLANYDVKWTATAIDDRWRGWAEAEEDESATIQAVHYTYVSYLETGTWLPFYFLIFGASKWVRVLKFIITESALEKHKERIANTVAAIKRYEDADFKGTGDFNTCQKCPFKDMCPDRTTDIKIEEFIIFK